MTKHNKNGFTYIELCIALTLLLMMITPLGMMQLTSMKTRVTLDKFEEISQKLDTLTNQVQKDIALTGTFSVEILDDIYYQTDKYSYDIQFYSLDAVPSDIQIDKKFINLLKSNDNFNRSQARVTFKVDGIVSCQDSDMLYVGERAPIKRGEVVIGTYLDIAKKNTSLELYQDTTVPFIVALDVTKLEVPFIIKLSNATTQPVLIKLQGDTTQVHFILDDPNGQTTLIHDTQRQQIQYKIVKIQIKDKDNQDKVMTQTVFVQPYIIKEQVE